MIPVCYDILMRRGWGGGGLGSGRVINGHSDGISSGRVMATTSPPMIRRSRKTIGKIASFEILQTDRSY